MKETRGDLESEASTTEYYEGSSETDLAAAGRPPETIGEFEIRRVIGQGGMATVYEAYQPSMRREVALKVLHVGLTASSATRSRFEREAWIGGRLGHPNIVTVYGHGEHRDASWIAMELVAGRSLHHEIEEARQRTWDGDSSSARVEQQRIRGVVKRFIGVVDALAFAHERGIVHRDIKPLNLLQSSRDDRLMVTDFGLAHDESTPALTRRGDFFGTVRYMSPEQLLAHRITVDHRSDLWSAGVSLYEAVTLQLPFAASSEEGYITAVSTQEPKRARAGNHAVPVDLETILMRCLERDPSRRYTSAAELRDDLKRFLDGEPVRARRPGMLRRAGRALYRRRKEMIGAVTAAVVMGLVGWGSVSFIRDQREHSHLTDVLERVIATGTAPDQLTPDWDRLQVRLVEEVAEDFRGATAVLAARAAVQPTVRLGATFGLVDNPPLVVFEQRRLVDAGQPLLAMVDFEGSWDGGLWHQVGGCGMVIGGNRVSWLANDLDEDITGGARLMPGPHRLDVRAQVRGFFLGQGGLERAPDIGRLDSVCGPTSADIGDVLAKFSAITEPLDASFDEMRELPSLEPNLFASWPDDFPRRLKFAEVGRFEPPVDISKVRLVMLSIDEGVSGRVKGQLPEVPPGTSEKNRDVCQRMGLSFEVTLPDVASSERRVEVGVELIGLADLENPIPLAANLGLFTAGSDRLLFSSTFVRHGQTVTLGSYSYGVPGGELYLRAHTVSEETDERPAEPLPDGTYRARLELVPSREVALDTRQLDRYLDERLVFPVELEVITVPGVPEEDPPASTGEAATESPEDTARSRAMQG